MKVQWLIMSVFFVLAPWAGSLQAGDMGQSKILTFGVVPQQTPDRLARNWGGILRFIELRTGFQIAFRTAPTIPDFEQRLRDGEYDLAYMNPYHYIVFHEQPGYQAIAHARDKLIQGILVVAKDSSIDDIDALEGKALAFPSPAAFAASMLPRHELERHGIHFSPNYVVSHDAVYRTVAEGVYPAGGGILRTFESTSAEVREKLRVLWTTSGYSPHPLAVHPRVPTEVVQAVQQALIEIHQQAEGAKWLAALQVNGFEIAEDSDWNDVRELKLTAPIGLR